MIPQILKYGIGINLPLHDFPRDIDLEPNDYIIRIKGSAKIVNQQNETQIVIPAKSSNLIEINLNSKSAASSGNIAIFAGENSNSIIIEKLNSDASSKLVAHNVKIFSDSNSEIKYITLQNLSKHTYSDIDKSAELKFKSRIEWRDFHIGSKTGLIKSKSVLLEEKSSSEHSSIFFADDQNFDLHIQSIHKGRSTISNIFTRSVLDGRSKIIQNGLVKIEKTAGKSEGYQKSDSILLSEYAEVDPIPQLNIENDDVKCGHGSTIGRIGDDKIFYLMSRGLSYNDAYRKIVEGFFSPVLDKIGDQELREEISQIIDTKYQLSKKIIVE